MQNISSLEGCDRLAIQEIPFTEAGHPLEVMAFFQVIPKLPGCEQVQVPTLCSSGKNVFQFSQILQRDFTHDRLYVLKEVKVQGLRYHLWPQNVLRYHLWPQRARINAEAFHSLELLGVCSE